MPSPNNLQLTYKGRVLNQSPAFFLVIPILGYCVTEQEQEYQIMKGLQQHAKLLDVQYLYYLVIREYVVR